MNDGNTPSAAPAPTHNLPQPDTLHPIIAVPLDALRPSTTKVQAERRARFDAKALDELAATIREVGVLEPILVRPLATEPPTYEIVAGERRWRAASDAKLTTIPAILRDLTDPEVLRLQLIENIQREELHPLAEVEAFEQLLKQPSYTLDRLIHEVAKPRSYILHRLKLLALCAPARQAFSKGKLTLATAFLLARIPVESLQRQALKDLTEERSEPMTARAAAQLLETRYMLRLADAAFPTQDPDLVPTAGACGTCPKRTGNQPELFKDVQGADVCTDPTCFTAKRTAFAARQIEAARTAGRNIIEGTAAKKIAPYGAHHLQGYVRPTDRCYEDKKNRTWRQLLGDAVPASLLVVPDTGDVIEVIDQKAAAPILNSRGIGIATRSNDSERTRRAKAKLESAYRWKLFEAVRAQSPTHLARADLEQLAITTFTRHGYEARKRLIKVWGWDTARGKGKDKNAGYDGLHHDEAARTKIPKLSDADLARFLLDCVYVTDLHVSTWSDDKAERLSAAAKHLRIDIDTIRAEFTVSKRATKGPRPAKVTARKRD